MTLWWAAVLTAWAVVGGARIVATPAGLLEVAWRGCSVLTDEAVCLLAEDSKLVIWVRWSGERQATDEQCKTLLAARVIDPVSAVRWHHIRSRSDGCSAECEPQQADGRLVVMDRAGAPAWTLAYAPRPERAPVLVDARARIEDGDLRGAITSLEHALAAPLDTRVAAEAATLLQELAFTIGKSESARTWYAAAMSYAERSGWRSVGCDATFTRLHHEIDAHSGPALMEGLFAAARRCVVAEPHRAIDLQLKHSAVAEAEERHVEAWRLREPIAERARRLQDEEFAAAVLSMRYVLADRLGLRDELAQIEAEMKLWLDTTKDPVPTALTNLYWKWLMRRERGQDKQDARPLVTSLQSYYSDPEHGHGHRREHWNATINLALAAWHVGDDAQARSLLVPLADVEMPPELALWRHIVLIRVWLRSKDLELALRHLGRLDWLAQTSGEVEPRWYAANLRAHAEAARGDRPAALAAYRRAEAIRDGMSLPLEFGNADERADERWEQNTQELLMLLATAPEPDWAEILQSVRLARRRPWRRVAMLMGLDDAERAQLAAAVEMPLAEMERLSMSFVGGPQYERDGWAIGQLREDVRRHIDEAIPVVDTAARPLRPPAEGEVLLAYYPLGGVTWLAMAADRRSVSGRIIVYSAEDNAEQAGSRLLAPFAKWIDRAATVRVLATGEILVRGVHALSYRGQPLLASRTVVYALDLDEGPRTTSSADPRAGLVVTSDPNNEYFDPLPAIAAEAKVVVARWQTLGVEVTYLADEAATRGAIHRGLAAGVDILHLAGHAAPPVDRREATDGWARGFPLLSGGVFGVEDVLTLAAERMPQAVVISACESAGVDRYTHSGGLSLGQSFLVRGSRLVVAADRDIEDSDALQFVSHYAAEAQCFEDLADPATLARAQRRVLASADPGTWPTALAFRAWVP